MYNVREPVTVLGRSGTAERGRFTVLRQGGDIFRLSSRHIRLGFLSGSIIHRREVNTRERLEVFELPAG